MSVAQGQHSSNGTELIHWDCAGVYAQAWYKSPVTGPDIRPGSFRLRSRLDPDKCVSVKDQSTANGAPIILWTCLDINTGPANFQIWY